MFASWLPVHGMRMADFPRNDRMQAQCSSGTEPARYGTLNLDDLSICHAGAMMVGDTLLRGQDGSSHCPVCKGKVGVGLLLTHVQACVPEHWR